MDSPHVAPVVIDRPVRSGRSEPGVHRAAARRRVGAAGLSGRLTHVATGEASHFDSGDELVTLLVAESDRLRAESERLRRTVTRT